MTPVVLHLIPSLSGGGAERQVSYLIPALAAIDIEAHLAYVMPGPNIERFKGLENRLHKLRAASNYDPRLYSAISGLIGHLSPDIVQTWLTQMDVLGGLAAIRRGKPFIVSERNSANAYPASLKNAVRKKVGLHAAAIVANSNQGLEYWQSDANRSKMVAISNGIPISEIDSFRDDTRDANSNNELLLFAGRYVGAKNVEITVRAFLKVLEHRSTAEAYLFGKGSLKSELQAIVSNSPHCRRIHVCDYTDVLWQWMNRASVFVSLSKHEGQPNTVLEAATLQCPLVLSDIPAHREAVGPSGALWIKSVNVDAAFGAIMDALDSRQNTGLKIAAAREMAENYSIGTLRDALP